MKTALVQIGNSRGIRIPTEFLEQCQLRDVVELELRGGHLIIRPTTQTRSGWEDAFRNMRIHQDDTLPDETYRSATEWDTTQWEW